MTSAEIRTAYLKFFEARGHTIHPSASLVPDDDPSLLFTGAGMNQFKDMFLGRGRLPFRRATTTQKCLRVPDLDEVGRTPSHHTFFEMLGNFSFGDYFKQEAIAWADELLRAEFGIDRNRLRISIFEDDDEAFACWQKVGYAKDRIYRYGEKDNFWPSEAPSKGPNGPCGPCSEIYFDFGESLGGSDDPAENGLRFAEIWNLVFTQFDRRDGGVLEPLPQRNIDTGMGFERMVRVLQGGATNFDTDLFAPILNAICEASGCQYGDRPELDRAMRRIADHTRAGVFAIADGVLPSNEKQGYVIRKILRRAVADGLDSLRLRDAFLDQVGTAVIDVPGMAETFPELRRHRDRILRTLREEETKFRETYERGRELLDRELESLRQSESKRLPGKSAFFLWDTAGFPLDLTKRILEDEGLELDESGFERAMEQQRQKSRAGSNLKAEIFDTGPLASLKGGLPETQFVGYDRLVESAAVLAMFDDDGVLQRADEGAAICLLFERTPFYAESGGQVGDRGRFETLSGRVRIQDTVKQDGFHLHRGTVISGAVAVGDHGELRVDGPEHREPTVKNHTATHLLHWALRRVLGSGVEQRGSLVEPERLRFDFSHPRAMTDDELSEVERLVNREVLANHSMDIREQSFDEAVAAGAMALFGEKYGDRVRVVKVDDPADEAPSVELCGGTHVQRTGDIGFCRITAESGISAGVRRIEAVTGLGAVERTQSRERLLQDVARQLRTSAEELPGRVQALQDEIKAVRKELADSRRSQSKDHLQSVLDASREIGGVRVMVAAVDEAADPLATLADSLRDRMREPFAAVLVGCEDQKVPVLAVVDRGGQERGLKAGDLAKAVSKTLGGGGGGGPAFARGQGRDPGKRAEAVEVAWSTISAALGEPGSEAPAG